MIRHCILSIALSVLVPGLTHPALADSLFVPAHTFHLGLDDLGITDSPLWVSRAADGHLYLTVCVLGPAPDPSCRAPAPSVCVQYCPEPGGKISPREWCGRLRALSTPLSLRPGDALSMYPLFQTVGWEDWTCP